MSPLHYCLAVLLCGWLSAATVLDKGEEQAPLDQFNRLYTLKLLQSTLVELAS